MRRSAIRVLAPVRHTRVQSATLPVLSTVFRRSTTGISICSPLSFRVMSTTSPPVLGHTTVACAALRPAHAGLTAKVRPLSVTSMRACTQEGQTRQSGDIGVHWQGLACIRHWNMINLPRTSSGRSEYHVSDRMSGCFPLTSIPRLPSNRRTLHCLAVHMLSVMLLSIALESQCYRSPHDSSFVRFDLPSRKHIFTDDYSEDTSSYLPVATTGRSSFRCRLSREVLPKPLSVPSSWFNMLNAGKYASPPAQGKSVGTWKNTFGNPATCVP